MSAVRAVHAGNAKSARSGMPSDPLGLWVLALLSGRERGSAAGCRRQRACRPWNMNDKAFERGVLFGVGSDYS